VGKYNYINYIPLQNNGQGESWYLYMAEQQTSSCEKIPMELVVICTRQTKLFVGHEVSSQKK